MQPLTIQCIFISLQKWIEEHKQDYRGNRTGDLTDAYLAKIAENAPSFTEKGLGAMLREMFVIGAESESVMMRWSLRLFSVFKEVQDKVQAEIDSLKGTKKNPFFSHQNRNFFFFFFLGSDEDVNWEDRHNLHYTRATIAEIQRFADIAPTAVGHKVMYDVDFHGFHLPKVR